MGLVDLKYRSLHPFLWVYSRFIKNRAKNVNLVKDMIKMRPNVLTRNVMAGGVGKFGIGLDRLTLFLVTRTGSSSHSDDESVLKLIRFLLKFL